MPSTVKIRLDILLVERNHYLSRARARDAIVRGCVTLGGKPVNKPGHLAEADAEIAITDSAAEYVSRSALKLLAALNETGIDPTDKICLDIGASTGGFTQVLLQNGAKKVYAVDVGHGQLNTALAADPRVVNLERINARNLTLEDLGNIAPQFLVCDVSFISLKLALPPSLDLATPGSEGIFLIKPQFEVGRDKIGKGGLVREPKVAQECAVDLCAWLDSFPNWNQTHLLDSPLDGSDGNREYLMAGIKNR